MAKLIKELLLEKEREQNTKNQLAAITHNHTVKSPCSNVDLNELELCCAYPSVFKSPFALIMFANGRIAGKPEIARLAGVTMPTVDSTVEDFVNCVSQYMTCTHRVMLYNIEENFNKNGVRNHCARRFVLLIHRRPGPAAVSLVVPSVHCLNFKNWLYRSYIIYINA